MNKNLLHQRSEEGLEILKDLKPGTESYDNAVSSVVKLVDREIELEKIQSEHELKLKEHETTIQQLSDEKRDRSIKNGITIGTFIGGVVLTVWGSLKSWKFEETGTVVSGPGREFMKKLFKH